MTIKEYFTGRKKRYISLLVVIVMLAGMLPLSAIAHTGKLGSAKFDYTCGSDTDSTIPPEMLSEAAAHAADPDHKNCQAGRVWTTRNVEDKGDGFFTVTLTAVGLTYDNGKHPLAAGTPLVINDVFDNVNFDVVGTLPAGLVQDGSKITWTLANLSTDVSAPSSITYELQLTTREVGRYVTHPVAANATFKVTDDNWYYWSWTSREESIRYTASINWNNGTTSQIRQVDIVGVGPNGRNVTFDGRDGRDWMPKADFDKMDVKDYPARNFFTSVVSGQGDDKTFVFWFVVYISPGVYDIFDNVNNPVGNNGGNETYPNMLQKTRVYSDPHEENGNDGFGNVNHNNLTNKGWIELTLANYKVEENHYYKLITIDEYGVSNEEIAVYVLGWDVKDSGSLGQLYTAELVTTGPGNYVYVFEADKSSALSLNISANEVNNVIDLYYVFTSDLRIKADVEVFHVYTTHYYELENGRFVSKTDVTDPIPMYSGWRYVHTTFTATKDPADGFDGYTFIEAESKNGILNNETKTSIRIVEKNDPEDNTITLYYEKFEDFRGEPVDVVVNHIYDREEVVIVDGQRQTNITQGTSTSLIPGPWYAGETFPGAAEINTYNNEKYFSDEGNEDKLGTKPITSAGLVIDLYYSLYLEPATTTVIVKHYFRTFTTIIDEVTGLEDVIESLDFYDVVSRPVQPNVLYVGESFTAGLNPEDREGYTFNAADSDLLTLTLAASGNVIDLFYDKMDDDRDDASINVTHSYVTYLETIVNGRVQVVEVPNGSATPVAADSYEGYANERFTPVPRYEFNGKLYTLKSGSLDTVTLNDGVNATIELVYERYDSDLVEADLTVNYEYWTYQMYIDDNGVARYPDEPSVNTGLRNPWSPTGKVYVGQVIRHIQTGTESGYDPATTNPSRTHRISSNPTENVLTFVHTRYIPLARVSVVVQHHYKTYTYEIINGKDEGPAISEFSSRPVTITMYVGESFEARLREIADFGFIGAEWNNGDLEDGLMIVVSANGDRIDLYYERTHDRRVDASYIVNHHYFSVDFDGTRTHIMSYTDLSVAGFENMLVTASLNDFDGAYRVLQRRSSAEPNGFARRYDFPTIRLAKGDVNVIDLVYIQEIDSREQTEVVVNHSYSTNYTIDGVFSRSTNDGIFTETFFSIVDDEWVFWVGSEFTADIRLTHENILYTVVGEPELTIILEKEGNVINISYLRTINTTTPPREPDDPTPPPPPPPPPPPVIEEFEEIQPPLAELPEEISEEVDEMDFEDIAPPLSQMPQTGINDTFRIWILGLIISLLGLGALCFAIDYTTKKSRKKD